MTPAIPTKSAAPWLPLSLALLVLCIDGQSLGFDFVNWDDPLHVVGNRALLEPGQVPMSDHVRTPYLGYPIPLTVLSYHLNFAMGGLDAWGYHALNLLLAMANTALVFLCGLALGAHRLFAFLGAVLFAVHPATAEVVCWVTGRKDLLSMVFLLSFVLLLLTRTDRNGRALALLCLFCSLASKPLGLALPALCWVVDRWFHGRPARVSLVFTGLSGLLCAAFAVVSIVQQTAKGALEGATGLRRVGDAMQGGYEHLHHLLFPIGLLPKYVEGREADVDVWHAIVCVVVACAALAAILRTRHRSAPTAVAVVFVLCLYLPVSGVIPISRHIADTYLYGPLIGVVWLLGLGATWLSETRPGLRRPAAVIAVVVCVGLLPVRLVTATHWRDSVSLWTPTMARYPRSPQVCRSFGNAFLFTYAGQPEVRLQPDRAVDVYRHCIETLGHAEMYTKNMGLALYMVGDIDGARAALREAQRLRPDDSSIAAHLARLPPPAAVGAP